MLCILHLYFSTPSTFLLLNLGQAFVSMVTGFHCLRIPIAIQGKLESHSIALVWSEVAVTFMQKYISAFILLSEFSARHPSKSPPEKLHDSFVACLVHWHRRDHGLSASVTRLVGFSRTRSSSANINILDIANLLNIINLCFADRLVLKSSCRCIDASL